MKLYKFIPLIMMASALLACNVEDALQDPVISTEASLYELPAEGGQVQITFQSNMPWEITLTPGNKKSSLDGISVKPASGNGSKLPITVTVSAKPNESPKRLIYVSIIGTHAMAAVRFTQEGQVKGTMATPYTASELSDALQDTEEPGSTVFVSGVISSVGAFDAQTGTYAYEITDDGSASGKKVAFAGALSYVGSKFAENDIKTGDKVLVGCTLKLADDALAVQPGASLVTLNGTVKPAGEGTEEAPYNVARILKITEGLEDGKYIADDAGKAKELYVKAFIAKIDDVSLSYGNAQYWLSDDSKADKMMEVYRGFYFEGVKFTSPDQIMVGDEVTVFGKIKNYKGTIEFDSNNKIVEQNGSTEAPKTE